MADNDFELDVGVDSSAAAPGIDEILGKLQQTEQAAIRLNEVFKRSAASLAPAQAAMRELDIILARMVKSGATKADMMPYVTRRASASATYQDSAGSVNALKQELTAARLDLAQVKNEILKSKDASGRTLQSGQISNFATNATITNIETTADAMAARLAEALFKAFDRQVKTTTDAIEARSQASTAKQAAQIAQYQTPGYAEGVVTQAQVRAQALVRNMTGINSLEDLDARKAQEDATKAAAQTARAEARRAKLAENAIKRDEERFYKQDQNNLYGDAAADDAKFNRKKAAEERLVKIAERMAEREEARAKRETERQEKAAAAAVALEARKQKAAENAIKRDEERFYKQDQNNLYGDAAADDARFNKAKAAQERLAKIAEKQAERAEKKAASDAAKEAAKQQKEANAPSREEKIQTSVTNANDYRNAMLSSNGGADMLTFQARLLANYALIGTAIQGVRSAVGNLVEFDDVLGRFQAVTQTANSEMGAFRKGLLDVATQSRFTVSELAQVSITLAQTGLSASAVLQVLPAISNLASASGSSLAQAVDSVTSVLGAYGMAASQATNVSDILVGALNKTKLTMEQLQLGIQYSANIARESGVSFSELTATIGALAQAGIKSGSTLGTGTRQLIQELTAPSEKLMATMKNLGISFADINIRANGLTGVLENLREKGFTSADALKSLDLRAASAFAALVGQGDKVKILEQELLLTSAAAEGAAVANQSLSASLTRLSNQAFVAVDQGFAPFLEVVKGSTNALGGLFGIMNNVSGLMPVLGTGLAALSVALAGVRIVAPVLGLLGLGTAGAGIATAGVFGPVGIAIAAVTAAAIGLSYAVANAETDASKLTATLDRLKGTSNELKSRQTESETVASSITANIDTLIERREKLNSDPILRQNAIIQAQKMFGDLGLSIDSTSGTVNDLITALQNLRTNMAQQMPALFTSQLLNIQAQIGVLKEQIANVKNNAGGEIPGSFSFGNSLPGFLGNLLRPDQRKLVTNQLGEQFGKAYDYGQNPSLLNPQDPTGSTASLFAELERKRNDLQGQIDPLQLLKDTGKANSEQLMSLAGLKEQADILKYVNTKLTESVNLVRNLQAKGLEETGKQTDIYAAEIKASPEYADMIRRREDLKSSASSQSLAIAKNTGIGGEAQGDQLVRVTREIQSNAGEMTDEVNRFKERLLSEGKSPAAVKQALAELEDSLNGLAKSVTKDMQDLKSSVDKSAMVRLQAARRQNDMALKTVQELLSKTDSFDKIEEYNRQYAALIKERDEIEQSIITRNGVTNPDDLVKDESLMAALNEKKEESSEKLKQFALALQEKKKKLTDMVFKDQAAGLDAMADKSRSEAARLQKILNDAYTTPEKAKQLVEEINKLLDQAKGYALQSSRVTQEREENKGVAGPIPNITNAPPDSVAGQLIMALNQAGKGDLVNYALGTAKRESDFNLTAKSKDSSAAGLFQFIDRTWEGVGQGGKDKFNLENQVAGFIKLVEEEEKNFRAIMNRMPTDPERYVFHQQGGPTATQLYNNPNANAVDLIGRDKVLNNKGTVDMTAAEFIEHIKKQFTDSMTEVSKKYVTTSKEVAKNKNDDTNSKIESDTDKAKLKVQQDLEAKQRSFALRDLAIGDKALATQLAMEESAVRQSKSADEASRNTSKVIDTIAGRARKEVEKDDIEKSGLDRGKDDIKKDQAKIYDKYGSVAVQQAATGADKVGQQALKAYQDKVSDLQAELNVMSSEANKNIYTQTQIDAKARELKIAQEILQTEGQYKATQTEIAELERLIAELKAKGLGTTENLLPLEEKVAGLREKTARLQPQVDLRAQTNASSSNIGAGLASGVTDFEKSRGIRDSLGNLVDSAQQARTALSGSLNAIGSGFDTLFAGLATGSKSAKDLFKDFATSVLQNLAQLASKAVTNELFSMLFGSADAKTGSSGGILSQGLSALTGAFGIGKYNGGEIRLASGGQVPDVGVPTRDSVPILAQPGEIMMRKSAVDAIGKDKLLAMNAMGATVLDPGTQSMAPIKGGDASATANVYVVAPDQKPVPGPNDIIHTIADDIQRNGTIKQLIKRVQAN